MLKLAPASDENFSEYLLLLLIKNLNLKRLGGAQVVQNTEHNIDSKWLQYSPQFLVNLAKIPYIVTQCIHFSIFT